jgi:PAS domain S-box-containing protein
VRFFEFDLMNVSHFFLSYLQDDEARCALAYCLSFSNDESDFKRNFAQLDSIMKQQLEYVKSRSRRDMFTALGLSDAPSQKRVDTGPLPRSLEDALRPNKSRSIVVTEKQAPFRVVDVNSCWEQLCGYTYVESKGKTLGSLLRGPETDPLIATGMIAKLLQGEDEVGATIINYTKYGRPFRNRIRVGPLRNEFGDVTHFVGLLQEI